MYACGVSDGLSPDRLSPDVLSLDEDGMSAVLAL